MSFKAFPIPSDWPVRTGGWRTIVADPPWWFDDQGSRLATLGCANPYPPMPDEEILALPVGELAAPATHLYLWATDQHTELAFRCLRAWDYRFIQFIRWGKVSAAGEPRMVGGHYFRHTFELCLFAVRGRAPGRRHDLRAEFEAPLSVHSGKPEKFFDIVEAFSFGPRLELFARQPRLGWSGWGNQLRRSA